ncbi:MAG: CPBP family intramembrane glutamic endopeptidase [Acidobacteriota bacterium]
MTDPQPDPQPTTTGFPPPEPAPHKPNRFLFGRFGFRAGYGIAIYAAVFVVLQIIGGLIAVAANGQLKEAIALRMQAAAHPGSPAPHLTLRFTPTLVFTLDTIVFAGLFLLCWILHRAERRPLANFGLAARRAADLIPGSLWGFTALSIVVAILAATHHLIFDGRALYGLPAFGYGIAWLFAFLAVGFCEEYSVRGYIQYTLMRGVWGWAERLMPSDPFRAAFWIAATITSLFFGLMHTTNKGENVLGIIMVVLFAMMSCYALWRTGSLWWSIGFHALWDWAQSFLFGVADSGNVSVGRLFVTHPAGKPWLSGGADGPEGSIVAFFVLLLFFAVIRFTTTPGEHPSPERALAPLSPPQEPTPAIA